MHSLGLPGTLCLAFASLALPACDGGPSVGGTAAEGEGEGEGGGPEDACAAQKALDPCDRDPMFAACGGADACVPDRWMDPAVCDLDAACPGGPGCATGEGPLRAGFSRVDITPGFETPDEAQYDGDGHWDGSRFDPDTFNDCGRDRLCPGDEGYAGPDADGSEGDGRFQGAWLAGFSNQRPALGVHDPMWARCVVFDAGDTRVALVSLDLVGFFYNELERIRAALDPAAEVDLVVMSSTHSHEVPDTLGQWGPDDSTGIPTVTGRDDVTQKGVRDGAVRCIEEAVASLRPAEVHHTVLRTGIEGFSRDARDPFIHDDELPVMRVEDTETGRILGTISNWGSHPEALSDENTLISSDFPHWVRKTLEEGLPEDRGQPAVDGVGGVAVYFSGAVGGLTTPLGVTARWRDGTEATGEGNWAKTQAIGEGLGLKAIEASGDAELDPDPSIAFVTREFLVPVVNGQFIVAFFGAQVFDRPFYNFQSESDGRACLFTETNYPWVRTQIALIRLGQAVFMTTPGEIFPETVVGFDEEWRHGHPAVKADNPNPPDLAAAPTDVPLKRIMPGRTVFLLGLGNDELGYMVPPYDFELAPVAYFDEAEGDHYEETNSVGPAILPLVEGHTRDLAGRLR